MFRKLLLIFAVVALAAAFILPAGAQFFPFSPFGTFGFGPFGTSYSTGFTTASTFTSGFASVNGVAVPFGGLWGTGIPLGLGSFWGTGIPFGSFSPF